MSGNFKKEDLRVQKTHKYLRKSLESLLEKKNFKQITVNDLCEEALISRAAFYSHFKDKYDLLESWLSELAKRYDVVKKELVLAQLVYDKARWIKNIIYEADGETKAMIHSFAVKTMERIFRENRTDKNSVEFIVLSHFCVGGLIHFLLWQIEHGYPSELSNTVDYLQQLLENAVKWDANNKDTSK